LLVFSKTKKIWDERMKLEGIDNQQSSRGIIQADHLEHFFY